MELKKNNSVILSIKVKDSENNLIENLFEATNIYFTLKENKTDIDSASLVYKTLGSGIEVNNPTTGYIKVDLGTTNTNLNPGTYYIGLQVEYDNSIQEVILKENLFTTIDTVDIVQDTVRG